MAGALAYAKHDGIVVNTADEALNVLLNNGEHDVIVYNSNKMALRILVDEIVQKIKELNKSITDLDQKWAATNAYYWDDIDGCLAVECAEISIERVKDAEGKIALFSGWDMSVLKD